jgi:hypothetical protein
MPEGTGSGSIGVAAANNDPAMGYYPGWRPSGCAAGPQDSRAYQGVTPQNFPDFGVGAGQKPLPGNWNQNSTFSYTGRSVVPLPDNSLPPTPQSSITGSPVVIPGFPGSTYPDTKPQTLPVVNSVVNWDKIYADSSERRQILKTLSPYSDEPIFGF